MKEILVAYCLLFIACTTNKLYPKAENALDAGREFIDAYLKGDFEKAQFYLINDIANKNLLATLKNSYSAKKSSEKSKYKVASITILQIDETNRDTVLIAYQNSFTKQPNKIKAVNVSNEWKVDLKGIFKAGL